MEQSDKPLFVFYIIRQLARYPTQVLSSNKAIYKLAWAFPYPSNKLHHDAHPVQLYLQLQMQITLVVDPLYCKNSASQQKSSFFASYKIAAIQLSSQLASCLIFFIPSFKRFKPVFPFLSFPFLTLKKATHATQLAPYLPPAKVSP